MVDTVKLILHCLMLQLLLYGSEGNDFPLQPFDLDTSWNLFFINLYPNIITTTNDNIIISPFTIFEAMALIYTGSGGITKQVLENGLFIGNANKEEVANSFNKSLTMWSLDNATTLDIANNVYVMTGYNISTLFQSYVNEFNSSAKTINFTDSTSAANIINSLVEQETNYKIENVVTPSLFDSDTRLILVNAVYFKADWLYGFDIQATHKAPFYTSSNVTEQIDMMQVTNFFQHTFGLTAKCLLLPFKTTGLSMLIILPKDIHGLPALENQLITININTIFEEMEYDKYIVTIPKFSISYQSSINEILRDMGMDLPFSYGADFNNMFTSHESIPISNVIHKVHIEVSEQSAGPAPEPVIQYTIPPSYPPHASHFNVDHPFAFYILYNLEPLFVGRFTN